MGEKLYSLYTIQFNRHSGCIKYCRVQNNTGKVEVLRAELSRKDGVTIRRQWRRSNMSLLDLLQRLESRWWMRHGRGAILVAKNVRFKNV